jgi:hypothetical protein
MGRRIWIDFQTQKKRATEVAQNALRAHCFQKDLRFALVRIFPDKKSKPCKKQNHEAGAKLTNQAGEEIDRDQCRPRLGVKEGK